MKKLLVLAAGAVAVGYAAAGCAPQSAPEDIVAPAAPPVVIAQAAPEKRPIDEASMRALAEEVARLRAQLAEMQNPRPAKPAPAVQTPAPLVERVDAGGGGGALGEPRIRMGDDAGADEVILGGGPGEYRDDSDGSDRDEPQVTQIIERETIIEREVPVEVIREVEVIETQYIFERVEYGDVHCDQWIPHAHSHFIGCGHHYYGCTCHPWYYDLRPGCSLNFTVIHIDDDDHRHGGGGRPHQGRGDHDGRGAARPGRGDHDDRGGHDGRDGRTDRPNQGGRGDDRPRGRNGEVVAAPQVETGIDAVYEGPRAPSAPRPRDGRDDGALVRRQREREALRNRERPDVTSQPPRREVLEPAPVAPQAAPQVDRQDRTPRSRPQRDDDAPRGRLQRNDDDGPRGRLQRTDDDAPRARPDRAPREPNRTPEVREHAPRAERSSPEVRTPPPAPPAPRPERQHRPKRDKDD